MMLPLNYILDEGGNPVAEPDTLKWALWIEAHRVDRVVDRTQIGEALISTVFLAINCSFGAGPPQLFETMIFDTVPVTAANPHGLRARDGQWRCSSRDEALAGHAQRVAEETARQEAARLGRN